MNFLRAGIVTIICLFLFFGFSPLLHAGTFYPCDGQIIPNSYCSNLGCTGYQEVKPLATNAGCQCTGCENACAKTCGAPPKAYQWSNTDGCTCSTPTTVDCTNKCPSTCPNDCHADSQTNACVCNDTKPTDPTDPSTGGSVTIGPPFGASGPQSIGDLIKNITDWVLGLSGAIAVLFIIIAGFRYITAHGDSKQTEAAKTALRNAIIGLVIVILSFFIVRIIITVLSGQA